MKTAIATCAALTGMGACRVLLQRNDNITRWQSVYNDEHATPREQLLEYVRLSSSALAYPRSYFDSPVGGSHEIERALREAVRPAIVAAGAESTIVDGIDAAARNQDVVVTAAFARLVRMHPDNDLVREWHMRLETRRDAGDCRSNLYRAALE